MLQIAKPILHQSGGGIVQPIPVQKQQDQNNKYIQKPLQIEAKNIISTSFAIPGIPIPSMAGVLTGIKAHGQSQALFSLPGMRLAQSQASYTATTPPASIQDLKPPPAVTLNEHQGAAQRPPLSHIPGMPGPSKDQISTIPKSISDVKDSEIKGQGIKIEVSSKSELALDSAKFLRPNSLPLTPGTFKTKKHVMLSGGDTLVSPETPRPRKSYMLQYQNGTAYSTLGFKSSTKVYYTTIFHQQPMYVANKPGISMYSNWRVVTKDSHPSGLNPSQSLNAYYSTSHCDNIGEYNDTINYTTAGTGRIGTSTSQDMIVSHSSKWKALKEVKNNKTEQDKNGGKNSNSENSNSEGTSGSSSSGSHVPRTVEGGYKSLDDDYT